jgi:DNA-binding response OmpR family regulator
MAKAKILCVDDDRPTVTIISGVLRKENYEVEVALNGQDALKKAHDFRPDLILLDIMMPGMDGYEVCRHLRDDEDTSKIGVIMLTAKGGVDDPDKESYVVAGKVKDRLRGFDSGAIEFLTKPVKAKELTQRVKAVLWASGFPV